MRRLVLLFAVLVPLAGLSLAGSPPPSQPRFEPPRVITAVGADYPANSIAWGTVILDVEINDLGRVRNVRAIRDIKSLTEPATRAVRQWKFEPARLDGKPLDSHVTVAFTFNIPPWCHSGTP